MIDYSISSARFSDRVLDCTFGIQEWRCDTIDTAAESSLRDSRRSKDREILWKWRSQVGTDNLCGMEELGQESGWHMGGASWGVRESLLKGKPQLLQYAELVLPIGGRGNGSFNLTDSHCRDGRHMNDAQDWNHVATGRRVECFMQKRSPRPTHLVSSFTRCGGQRLRSCTAGSQRMLLD